MCPKALRTPDAYETKAEAFNKPKIALASTVLAIQTNMTIPNEIHTQNLPINDRIQPDNRTRQSREDNSTDKSPGDRPRKDEMVILSPQRLGDIGRGNTVAQNVMNSLDMEGLLDLGIGRNEEMGENQDGDCEGEERDWIISSALLYRRSTNPEVSSWSRDMDERVEVN